MGGCFSFLLYSSSTGRGCYGWMMGKEQGGRASSNSTPSVCVYTPFFAELGLQMAFSCGSLSSLTTYFKNQGEKSNNSNHIECFPCARHCCNAFSADSFMNPPFDRIR